MSSWLKGRWCVVSEGEEWIVYRVSFPLEGNPEKSVTMDVSAHPLRGERTIKHQVWILLSQKGYDLDPIEGGIEAIGTEVVKQG